MVVPLLEEISLDPFSNLASVFRSIPGVALSLRAIGEPSGEADS